MSLKQWLDNGWLCRHQSSAKEISDPQFTIFDRYALKKQFI